MPSQWTVDKDRRVLLAVIAGNPELKLDYAKLAALCGETTRSGVEHRFRILKKEAAELVENLESGKTQAGEMVVRKKPATTIKNSSPLTSPTSKVTKSPRKRDIKRENDLDYRETSYNSTTKGI